MAVAWEYQYEELPPDLKLVQDRLNELGEHGW